MITELRPMLWTGDLKGSVDFMSRSLASLVMHSVMNGAGHHFHSMTRE